jgi:NAD(P)H-dependent FMN reductase
MEIPKIQDLYIPIILGTAREGRQSEKAARFLLKEAEKTGIKTELIDVKDFKTDSTDTSKTTEASKILSKKIKEADALIIVTPEYNHSFPGELKLMLDSLYSEYNKKPVDICGVSAGNLGGSRVVEQLRLVCIELQMIPIRSALYFSSIQTLTDNIDQYTERAEKFLDELIWYAKALKFARENIN